MIRGYEDLLVGIVSVTLGLLLGIAAATDWHWYYSLRTARFLEARLGRGGVRCLHSLLAVGLISLGIAVAAGYRFSLFGR